MTHRAWWNPHLGPLSFCAALAVLHAALKEFLAAFDVVSSMFAAGSHVPRWMLAVAGLFALVRLAVFLLIPPLLAWWAVHKWAGGLTPSWRR